MVGSLSSIKPQSKYLLKNVFNEATEGRSYWVGFLLGDGCVHYPKRGGSPAISLSIKKEDCQHLIKFRNFLGVTNKITCIGEKYVSFRIQNFDLVKSVESYGVVANKSHTAEVHYLADDRHMWRGVVDADGCISIKHRLAFNLVGSKFLLEQFVDFLRNNGLRSFKAKVGRHKSIYQFGTTGNFAIEIISLLYRDCSVYLDRKKLLADKIINDQEMYQVDTKRCQKLDEGSVRFIFLSKESHLVLASKFGVSTRTICSIKSKETWVNITSKLLGSGEAGCQ